MPHHTSCPLLVTCDTPSHIMSSPGYLSRPSYIMSSPGYLSRPIIHHVLIWLPVMPHHTSCPHLVTCDAPSYIMSSPGYLRRSIIHHALTWLPVTPHHTSCPHLVTCDAPSHIMSSPGYLRQTGTKGRPEGGSVPESGPAAEPTTADGGTAYGPR